MRSADLRGHNEFLAKALIGAATLLAASAFAAGAGPAALGASAATAASAATVNPGPWTQTDYNGAMSQANPGETTLTPATLSKIGYLRSLVAPPDVNSCNPDQGYVAPLLSGGDVYAMANSRLVEYQASNGQTLWQSVPDPTWSSTFVSLALAGNLVVADGDVIASGASVGAGTVISATQASNGKLLWQQDYGCFGGNGPAVVVGGVVVFAACTDSNNTPFLQGDSLATGAKLWRRSGSWQVQRGDLAAAGGKNVFATSGGSVFDLSPQTGATTYELTGASTVLAVTS